MRELLFRAKRLDNGKWVESGSVARNEYEDGSTGWFIGSGQPAEQTNDDQGNMVAIETRGECLFYACDPETTGQYTGLTDKNGKKIFEDDIVQAHFRNNHSKQIFRVVFDDGMFLFDNNFVKVPKYEIYSMKVIGNIHDNPELLEVEDGK